MKIFFAGATGVIGKRVVPQLVSAGHQVTAAVRSEESAQLAAGLGAVPLMMDLFNEGAIGRALEGQETVINLATSVPPSSRAMMPGAWSANDRMRREVSRLISRAAGARGVRRYIQESFAPVYPDRGDKWIDETVAIRPARYNRGVGVAEEAVGEFSASGREGVVLRFGYFYGPDSDFTRDMVNFVRKGWAPAPGSPDAYYPSVAHDDAAAAVVSAITLPPGIYNVVDDEPLTHRELFGSLAQQLGARAPRFAPAWMKHLLGSLGETLGRSQRISDRKLRGASGWKPKFPSAREGWAAVLQEMK